MSDWADKTITAQPETSGKAQASRAQLLVRWGAKLGADGNVVTIDTMGGRETWRRIRGDVFELESAC